VADEGGFKVDDFPPVKDRKSPAATLNALLASPTFASWSRASRSTRPNAAHLASGEPGDDFSEQVRLRARKVLNRWEEVIANAKERGAPRTYSGYDSARDGPRRCLR
jgi:hypothetical protein